MAESLRLSADGDFHPFRTEHKTREEVLPGRVFLDEWPFFIKGALFRGNGDPAVLE